jgi:hypothetical protein
MSGNPARRLAIFQPDRFRVLKNLFINMLLTMAGFGPEAPS